MSNIDPYPEILTVIQRAVDVELQRLRNDLARMPIYEPEEVSDEEMDQPNDDGLNPIVPDAELQNAQEAPEVPNDQPNDDGLNPIVPDAELQNAQVVPDVPNDQPNDDGLNPVVPDAELQEKEQEKPKEEPVTLFNMPLEILVKIFQYMWRSPESQSAPDFDVVLESRTEEHFNEKRQKPGHYPIRNFLLLRRVCRGFNELILDMHRHEHMQVPIDIRIKGETWTYNYATLYKYGGSGARQPAIFMRRLRYLIDHIENYEVVRKLIISSITVSDFLIDALLQPEAEPFLVTVEEVEFVDIRGYDVRSENRDEKVAQLVKLFEKANHIHFDAGAAENDVWGNSFVNRLKRTTEPPPVLELRHRVAVRRRTHLVTRFFDRQAGETRKQALSRFLEKVKVYKRYRLVAILQAIVFKTTSRYRSDLNDDKTNLKYLRRSYRDFRNAVSGQPTEYRLWVRLKFVELCRCFRKNKRVKRMRVLGLIRELLKFRDPILRTGLPHDTEAIAENYAAVCRVHTAQKAEFMFRRRNYNRPIENNPAPEAAPSPPPNPAPNPE